MTRNPVGWFRHAQLSAVQLAHHGFYGADYLGVLQQGAVLPRFFDQFLHGAKLATIRDRALKYNMAASGPGLATQIFPCAKNGKQRAFEVTFVTCDDHMHPMLRGREILDGILNVLPV